MGRPRKQGAQSEAETEVTPPESAPLESAEPSPAAAWLAFNWARLKSFGLSRLLLIIVGGGALGVGVFNAFSSEASTAPLIVGAVLLLAALLIAPEWREIRARHGETEISILRGVETRLEATESKTEEELRAEIAELKEDVQRAREAVERGDVARAVQSDRPRVYVARHSFSDGKVLLTLEAPPGTLFEYFRCIVRDPDMKTASSKERSVGISVFPTAQEITVVYPDEFEGAEVLKPGTYLAEWRRRSAFLWAVHALTGDPVVARDTWTVNGA